MDVGKRSFNALCILLACCRCAPALNPSLDISQYPHDSWTVREGFFKGIISSIAQTPDAYLWLGTEFGLVRFDGVRCVPWQPPAGERLPRGLIRSLLGARDGTLWIGSDQGLASWKDGRLTHYPDLDGQAVGSLFQDREGTVWAGRHGIPTGGLCAIQSHTSRCYGEDGRLDNVGAIYEDRAGNLWAGAQDGLWRCKPGPPTLYSTSEPVFALLGGNKGELLIAMRSGIRQLVDGKIEPHSLPGARHLLRDRDGSLWAGGIREGLLHVHQGRTDVFGQSDGLSGGNILALFEDREGNIWTATASGLDRFRELAAVTISAKQGLFDANHIASIVAGPDGSIWLGTLLGLNRWKDGQIIIYRRKWSGKDREGVVNNGLVREITDTGLPDDRVLSVLQDHRGRIWVSTLRGVAYFENGRFIPLRGVPGGFIHSMAEDSAGDVWMTRDEDLIHLHGGSLVEQIPWANLGRKDFAFALSPDPVEGGLWLGFFQGGVTFLKGGQVRASYSATEGLGNGRVNGFRLDRDGAVWAATEGGLSRIKNGRIATLTSNNGLPCDNVDWVMEDDAGSFWLNMACGLVRISRTEMGAWDADPARRIQSKVFDSSDGVSSHAFYGSYSPRVAKSADGKLWFTPYDNGVSVIDPRYLPFNKLAPPVHIEQIIADRKTYWDSMEYPSPHLHSLPPRIRDLVIDYTALSFVAPEKVQFLYKLEGHDGDWQDAGNRRQAFYNDLAPGNYRFRVKACNNSGVWNEAGASLDFEIAPAYYQATWFRVLLAASFLTSLWAAYQLRVRQVRREEGKLRAVIETIPTIAWTALPDGSVDFVNRRWHEYTGLSVQETAGSGWESVVHASDLQRYAEKWRVSVGTGEPFDNEVRFRRAADGQYRWFLTRAVALRDARGKILKWFGISTEIEDRKLAEQERETLRADLAHVNRVTMLGELAASLSHELKQPITAAMTSARTALRWLKREQPDIGEACEAANRIVNAGTRSVEIIDRLRSLYKNSPPQRELVDVNESIREMVVLLRSEANRYAVSMHTDLADIPKITADGVQLQQVLMNLMLNAIEAMKETGGILTVKSELSPNRELLICVSDTGIGLPAEKADEIFNAFFTTKPQGSGMGLAISRSIIESHGGRLWATANDSRGATFHFTLPTTSEPQT